MSSLAMQGAGRRRVASELASDSLLEDVTAKVAHIRVGFEGSGAVHQYVRIALHTTRTLSATDLATFDSYSFDR